MATVPLALVLLPGLLGLIADGVEDPQALLADPHIPDALRVEAMHRLGVPDALSIEPADDGSVQFGLVADHCADVDRHATPATWRACVRMDLREAMDAMEGTPVDGLLDLEHAEVTCADGRCTAEVPPLPSYYQAIMRRHAPDAAPATFPTYAAPAPVDAAGPPATPTTKGAEFLVPTVIAPAMFATGVALLPWQIWAPRILRVLRRAALAAPLLGLYSRVRDDALLENETRKQIHALLEESPGATIQDVRQRIDIAWGTTVYHLEKLEKAGILISQRHGNHRRYFVVGTKEARRRVGFSVLQAHTARRLAQAVMTNPGANQTELCAEVGIGAPVASKYLKRLEEHSLVRIETQNRFKHYQPTSLLRDLPDTTWQDAEVPQ